VVRAFEVAGEDGTCVAPTPETIAANEYPLSRDLFIYVNTADLESNPAVRAFVDHYLGDEGYQAVADAGYVQLAEDAWGETASAWEGAGGTPGEAEEGVSGEVVVSGSSTVEPISSLVAEEFAAANPDASVSVDGPGTGDGFELFCNGETDISDASRPIEEEEAAACEAAGIEYVELKVGIDGIAVLTQA
jgi:ABC-type phosphate transport system substrate-binding protein